MPARATSPLLFHYTDAGGFMGILQNSVLWATDLRYLNDSREFKYGMKGIVKAVETAHEKIPTTLSPETHAACAEFFEAVRTGQPTYLIEPTPKYIAVSSVRGALEESDGLGPTFGEHLVGSYVVSLTEHSDSLSQWQGYGNNGNGFAIGFDRTMLHDVTYRRWEHDLNDWVNSPTSPPLRVLYGRKARTKLVEPFIKALVDDSGEYVENFTNFTLNAVGSSFRLAALVKHPGFKNEAEWRLLASDLLHTKDIKFRPSGAFSLLPYLEMTFPKNAVRKVVVGPGRHAKLRISSVNQFLAVNGYSDVEVVPSSVPFRS